MKTIFITLSLLIASTTVSHFAAHAADGAISGNDPSVVVAAAPADAQAPQPVQETIVQRIAVTPEAGAATSDLYCEYQQSCFVNYYGYYICQWRYVCF